MTAIGQNAPSGRAELPSALMVSKCVCYMLSVGGNDDVIIDVCAYHCQQCVEKIAKFLILLQGDTYANDHRSDIYLEDLKDEDVVALIKHVASKIDYWATSIRYHHTILSNEKMVKEVLEICEKLIYMATSKIPEEAPPPASDMQSVMPKRMK